MVQLRRFVLVFAFVFALVVSGCAYSKHMNAGNKAFSEGNYEIALENYEAALKVDPNSQEARQKALESREKLVGQYADEVKNALVAGDMLRAMNAAAMAFEKLPDGDSTKALIRDVQNATFARAQELANEKDYANAMMLYDAIGTQLPPTAEEAGGHASTVRARWVQDLTAGAQAAEGAGRKGDAALQYAKLWQLTSDPSNQAKVEQLRTDILAEYRYVVKVGGRSSEGVNVVLGGLNAYGAGSALYVAQQVERGAPLNAEAKFVLNRPKFRTDKSARTETASYQSGTKQVENPFYKTRQDDLLREEERLTQRENEVTKLEGDVDRYRSAVAAEGDTPNVSTGAEQNLYNAENRLESARRSLTDQRNQVQRAREAVANEPQFREEPVYTELQYQVTTHTMVAESVFQATVKHKDARPPLEVEIPLATQASDDANDAHPVAGIVEDPLQLPPKGQLENELYSRALTEAKALIDRSFDDWRNALVERAVAASTDDERVDLMAIYIITNPRSVTAKVPADIAALRGIPDPVKILAP